MDNTIREYIQSNESTERQCNRCGSYVTKQFIRVFGTNSGEVYGCLNCLTSREVRNGKCRVK